MMISRKKAQEHVNRLIGEMYKTSPINQKKTRLSVYGKDYKNATSEQLGERLALISKLLDTIDRNPKYRVLEAEIMSSVESRFELVRDDIIQQFEVHNNRLIIRDEEINRLLVNLNPRLIKMMIVFSQRIMIRSKMDDLIRKDIDFSEEDYRYIGKEFDVPADDARELINMFKSCFNSEGRFLRPVFEKHIPVFAWYEKKIFAILWHFLKEIFHRNDRIAFLNSLQLLIEKMREPKKNAIKVLLADFLQDPYAIGFSDRNAIMLSNLLVRKYNKELNLDIEVTPEEVLQVKDGIDYTITHALSEAIDSSLKDRLLKKMSSIRRRIGEALVPNADGTSSMPIRYLLSLEREVFIFLCLIRGETALLLIRQALGVYGNSKSNFYRQTLSPDSFSLLIQHLRIIIRCIGIIGDGEDLAKLTMIRNDEKHFKSLARGRISNDKIIQMMKHIEDIREDLIQKDIKDTRDKVAFTVH